MNRSKSKDQSSPPSSEIGLGTVMNHLLEARGYARKIVEDSRDEETLDRAQCIVQRLTPTIIRLAELGQIENFSLTDEERASVEAKAREVA